MIRRKFKKGRTNEITAGDQTQTHCPWTMDSPRTVVPLFFCSSKQLGYYTFLTGLLVSVFSLEKFYDENRNSILLIGYRDVPVRHNLKLFLLIYKVTMSYRLYPKNLFSPFDYSILQDPLRRLVASAFHFLFFLVSPDRRLVTFDTPVCPHCPLLPLHT